MAAFQMKSPLIKIDIVVKNGQTGDAIGFVASVAASAPKPDFRYYIPGVFAGIVYPFTNDKEDPISDQSIDLPEGDFAPSQLKYGEWLKIENTGDMDTYLRATYNQSLSADVPLDSYKVGYIAYKFSEGQEMTDDILEESRIYLDELFNGTTNEVKSMSKSIAPGVEMVVGFVEEEEVQPAAKGMSGKAKMILGDGSKEGEKHEFWQLNDDQYIDLSFAIKLDEKAGNEYQGVTYTSNLNVTAKQMDDGAKN